MNQHVIIGHQLTQRIPFLARTGGVIRNHHERFDGTGYPDQMQGEQIPLLARIFSVADALDAMTSARPYRPIPFDLEEARTAISVAAGTQFCPMVVSALEAIPSEELEQIRNATLIQDDDLAALVEMQHRQDEPSHHRDILTGNGNRAAFDDLKRQLATARGADLGAVVFLDVNDLEAVNEAYGHATGDRVLADLGARLAQITGHVFRIGGDEFVLWFGPGQWNDAVRQRVAAAAAAFANYWSHLRPAPSAAWGTATAGSGDKLIDELVQRADRDMYRLKARLRRERA